MIPFLCIIIVLASATLQSFFGFGYALFGVPLLTWALGDIKIAVVFSTVTVFFHQVPMAVWAARKAPWLEMICICAGIIAGVEVGIRVFQGISSRHLMWLLGALLIVMGGWKLWGRQPEEHEERPFGWCWSPVAIVAGVVTGFVGVLTCATGPPLIIYAGLRGWPPKFIKAFLQPLFTVAVVSRLIRFISVGRLTWDWPLLWPALAAGVITVAITIIGLRMSSRVPRHIFDRGFYVLVCVFGLITFYKAFAG